MVTILLLYTQCLIGTFCDKWQCSISVLSNTIVIHQPHVATEHWKCDYNVTEELNF